MRERLTKIEKELLATTVVRRRKRTTSKGKRWTPINSFLPSESYEKLAQAASDLGISPCKHASNVLADYVQRLTTG